MIHHLQSNERHNQQERQTLAKLKIKGRRTRTRTKTTIARPKPFGSSIIFVSRARHPHQTFVAHLVLVTVLVAVFGTVLSANTRSTTVTSSLLSSNLHKNRIHNSSRNIRRNLLFLHQTITTKRSIHTTNIINNIDNQKNFDTTRIVVVVNSGINYLYKSSLSRSSSKNRRNTMILSSSFSSSLEPSHLPYQQESNDNNNNDDKKDTRTSTTTTTTTTNDVTVIRDWSPLDPETLSATKCLIEQTLCFSNGLQPQLAKDYDYANAILEAWDEQQQKQQEQQINEDGGEYASSMLWNTEWKSIRYNAHTTRPNPVNDTVERLSSVSTSLPSSADDDHDIIVPLYGHFIRKKKLKPINGHQQRQHKDEEGKEQEEEEIKNTKSTSPPLGILLFHTGAGPHDIFLLWKGSTLVNTLFHHNINVVDSNKNKDNDNFDNRDVIVLIADLFSDETGWGWNDEEKQKKQNVINTIFSGSSTSRRLLQDRIKASIDALVHEIKSISIDNINSNSNSNSNSIKNSDNKNLFSLDDVDIDNDQSKLPLNQQPMLAALGWCLGGKSILELSSMNVPGMRAMVSFHGVFYNREQMEVQEGQQQRQQQQQQQQQQAVDVDVDKKQITAATTTTTITTAPPKTEILLCNGCDDKFVTSESLEVALETFQNNHNIVSLLQLSNAKHGYTNPGQEYNPNQKEFGYHDESAKKSWKQAMALLRRKCST